MKKIAFCLKWLDDSTESVKNPPQHNDENQWRRTNRTNQLHISLLILKTQLPGCFWCVAKGVVFLVANLFPQSARKEGQLPLPADYRSRLGVNRRYAQA